jgi:PRTRC genetic system protein A
MNYKQILAQRLHILRGKGLAGLASSACAESGTPTLLRQSGPTSAANITGHLIARVPTLPPFKATMREYVFAGNGVFVRGRRPGLQVMMPTKFPVPLLPVIEPYVRLDYPRVPRRLVEEILVRALGARDEQGQFIEMLFYLSWDDKGSWKLEVPAQVQMRGQVAPLEHGPDSPYERALVEVHSHHEWPAFFSKEWDDRDEQGFRVYAVIGRIADQPELRTRIGLYGEMFEIPSGWILEMPSQIRDCVAEEQRVSPAGPRSSTSSCGQSRVHQR